MPIDNDHLPCDRRSARAIALEAGEVDLVWNVDTDRLCEHRGKSGCDAVEPDVLFHRISRYEYDKKKFADVSQTGDQLRWINRHLLIRSLRGRGSVANSYINSMIPGWTDGWKLIRMIRRGEGCLRKPAIERIRMQDLCKRDVRTRSPRSFRPNTRGWNHG